MDVMNDLVTTYTALPNLHPMVVHFPIALLPVALGFDLAALLRRRRWLDRAATVLYTLAGLAAWAALAAGEQAADSLVGLDPHDQSHLNSHSDWAHYTFYTLIVLVVLRLAVAWWDRREERVSRLPARWLLVLVALGGVGMLFWTADLGGGLVYEHGVAVQAESEGGHPATGSGTAGHEEGEEGEPATQTASGAAESAAAHLTRGRDGSLLWTPSPGDSAALGEILHPAQGSSLETVSVRESSAGGQGLPLVVDGRSLLVFAGSFGDLQVDAELDLTGFEGTVGVGHHVTSAREADLLTLSTGGQVALVRLRDGEREELDQGRVELPTEPLTLSVSAAGRHLKGLVDGRIVAHGHADPLPGGGAGLLLDGRGTIVLRSVKVTPIEK